MKLIAKILGFGWFLTCVAIGIILIRGFIIPSYPNWLPVFVFAWIGTIYLGRFLLACIFKL